MKTNYHPQEVLITKDRLDLFLNPRAMAIVGASQKSGPGRFNLPKIIRRNRS